MSGRLSASCTSGNRVMNTGPAAPNARLGLVWRITANNRSGCLAIIHFRNFAASPCFCSAIAVPLQRLQKFDDCVAIVVGQRRANDAQMLGFGVLAGELVSG